ncbi:hypothetical protein QQS21_003793 [Conoideocrella luteorostrata]|uniref:G-protein coupled receptors family 2 profile 2 domain-containing protein n=1 Tax=Conoideocrella luteorostrata TaxID=1105319 RepID=A0AAJ0G0C4_9HYPO|nr:hypothetical protein QQS21_003793 [Conoideocrella luteorostrata]
MPVSAPGNVVPRSEQFTHDQVKALITLERVGGSVSLASVVLIFIAYGLVRRVRNVQNTFIVFASVSNVGASVASIIAQDGLAQGTESTLCQTQSFLFEMFMQSDPWWSLAMAINVFLVFYFRTSPDSFRRWWWIYCVVCYGGPFVIALSLLLVRNADRGLVYGDATMWCWVNSRWDSIRIYTYYLLIWICIFGSIICYVLVGYHVFHSRNRLHSFSATKSREAGRSERLPSHDRSRPEGFYGTVTTEVRIIRTSANDLVPPRKAHLPSSSDKRSGFYDSPSPSPERPSPAAQYFSTVSAAAASSRSRTHDTGALTRIATATNSAASKFVVHDPIKRAYLRTSLLFAISVLVTWIPSSLNRIHSWLAGTSPYEFHLAAAAVLPLQGLWNSIIFFMTSWNVVKNDALRRLGRTTTMTNRARGDDGGFGTVDRTANRDQGRMSLDFEADSATMGSDVELRRVEHEHHPA